MSQLLEDMIFPNVLYDIYKSNVNELPKKHCILFVALEEMFHEMKKGNPLLKSVLDEPNTEYSELIILQQLFSQKSENNNYIKSYFNWIYDNISDSNFVDEFWSICVEKGTVVGAVRTTLDNNTGKLEHEIRKN